MKVKAAVAHQAGEPLRIETVDLEGPRAGEVMVEIKATGVCHTDAYTLSGADPRASGRRSGATTDTATPRGAAALGSGSLQRASGPHRATRGATADTTGSQAESACPANSACS